MLLDDLCACSGTGTGTGTGGIRRSDLTWAVCRCTRFETREVTAVVRLSEGRKQVIKVAFLVEKEADWNGR